MAVTVDNVTPDEFREGMSRLSAAVNVITTDGAAGRCGFTASSVCSVTDDPPTLLICLNRRSQMNAVFKRNHVFCINTLAADHEQLSKSFAGFENVSMEERFRQDRWIKLVTGAPVLATSLVSFDCRLIEAKEVGTHTVMFGVVQAVSLRPHAPALVYVNRGYQSVDMTEDDRGDGE